MPDRIFDGIIVDRCAEALEKRGSAGVILLVVLSGLSDTTPRSTSESVRGSSFAGEGTPLGHCA